MRLWPFRKRPPCASADAEASLKEARRTHRDAEALMNKASDVADRLSKTRERNHFGEALTKAIRGT